MAEYLIQDTTAQGIVNRVKAKAGITEDIIGSDIENAIDSILTPIDGTIPTKNSNDLTANGKTVYVPSGYYASDTSKDVSIVTQATPSISVDSSGCITASSVQDEGYVIAGTKTATKQLNVKAGTTITPGTSNVTAISKGYYATGNITVAGDVDLKASNIRSGVSIFGVTGACKTVTIAEGTTSDTSGGVRAEFILDKNLSDVYAIRVKSDTYDKSIDMVTELYCVFQDGINDIPYIYGLMQYMYGGSILHRDMIYNTTNGLSFELIDNIFVINLIGSYQSLSFYEGYTCNIIGVY